MIGVLFAIFLILHGLVHGLYFGQSARYFEMQPGLTWPDGSWAFSGLLGENGTRTLASILMVISTFGFVVGGVGMLLKGSWWRELVFIISVIAAAAYVLLWDGSFNHVQDKGAIGVLIDLAIIVITLKVQFPA